jgi:hypothetical protein
MKSPIQIKIVVSGGCVSDVMANRKNVDIEVIDLDSLDEQTALIAEERAGILDLRVTDGKLFSVY